MHASVNILNTDVDIMTNDIFIQKMNEYLLEDKLNVILFASTELLSLTTEDESFCSLIKDADLLLPGEEALLSSFHVDVLEAGDIVVNCKSFGMMLENLKKENHSMYIIGKGEEDIKLLESWCKKMQPELNMVGSCVYDSEMEDAALVNEINVTTPDMLLVDLPVGQQEKWIMDHAALMSANLCIAIGGVSNLIVASEKDTPEWIQKLHLEGIYQKLFLEQSVRNDVKARNFRKQVEQYHDQLEEENVNRKDESLE